MSSNTFSSLAGIGSSMLSIHLANQNLEKQEGRTVDFMDALKKNYEKNTEAVNESYLKNWYKTNFIYADERNQLIRQAGLEQGDFIQNVAVLQTAYDLAGSSYVNDKVSANRIDEEANMRRMRENHSFKMEDMSEEKQLQIAKLADNLKQQSDEATFNFNALIDKTRTQNIGEFMSIVGEAGGMAYDAYSANQEEAEVARLKYEISRPKAKSKSYKSSPNKVDVINGMSSEQYYDNR